MSSHAHCSTTAFTLARTIPRVTMLRSDPDGVLATRIDPRLRWTRIHQYAQKIAQQNAALRASGAVSGARMGQAPSAWRNRVRFAGVMIEARWVVLATMLVTFDVLLVVGTLLSRAGLLPL